MAGVVKSVKKVVTAHSQREGGGFVVRRPIGGEVDHVDPFLMLDHFKQSYGPGEAIGAPDHPHRGFETVSYILAGELQHKDSEGNSGLLSDGWVQWMTAGSGVVHSEMPSDRMMKEGGDFEGFQLWVNLPAALKMTQPRYQDVPPARIPVAISSDGCVEAKVIAGNCMGIDATIDTHTAIHFIDFRLKPGSEFSHPIPSDHNGFFYVYLGQGNVGLNDLSVQEGQAAIFNHDGSSVKLRAGSKGMKGLLICGEAIKEPIARWGPFVMNTQEQIHQAFEDYQSGKLGRPIEGAEARRKATQQAKAAQQSSGRWQQDNQSL